FVDELVRMANEPVLRTRFLLAVPETAQSLVDPLIRRIEGSDTACVHLDMASPAIVVPGAKTAVATPIAAQLAAPRAPTPASFETDDMPVSHAIVASAPPMTPLRADVDTLARTLR